MLDFSVIGLGSVGWAVIHGLHSKGFTYSGYDIIGQHDWGKIIESRMAFVCSSTPSGPNGRLDCSSVMNILERLDKDNYKGIIVVKSTVSVGFMDEAAEAFPNLHLVYMPEFLREKSCFSWFLEPDRLVIAGAPEDSRKALSLFKWVPEDKIIHTDFISAEIGKLAHNSYIATKVSFTNDIERICKEHGANAHDSMKIVWKDRRVNCSEHLTPGLGPFGGKCVVKDMKELLEVSDSPLLKAVWQVNEMTDMPETKTKYPDVAVIIPASHEMEYLRRALDSISLQTYKPRKVIVVSDQANPKNNEITEIVNGTDLPILHLINSRAQNSSGAINTGFEHLYSTGSITDDMFVALLDDDDWWEHRYLENCVKFSFEYDSDWVISGLIRHDEENPGGGKQSIPSKVEISDFLVGNPNVQNSNLFVRARNFKDIGGYDEDLVSTTDRDVSIRLLQAGTKYHILFNHLVHHDAFSRSSRLSQPGSRRKREGLLVFYKKYHDMMSKEERLEFKKRATKLFSIEIKGV